MAFDPNTDTGPQQPNDAGGGNSDWLKQLAAALAAAAGGLGGRAIANAQGNPLTQAVPPQLSQLLDMSVARTAYQNPLYAATTKGVYDMLPTFAKEGSAMTGTLSNAIPAAPPPSSGGNVGGLAAGAGAAGLGALLAALAGNSGGGKIDVNKIIDALKKKFGKKPGVNQPYGFTGPIDNEGYNSDPWPLSPDLFPGFNDPRNDRLPGTVDTDEFLGQWPETSDPFAPFDPNMLPNSAGGAGGDRNGYNWWEE
jgi:hypothetical protein